MFRRSKNLKVAVTLLVAVIIVVDGFGPAQASGPCMERDVVKSVLDYATSAPCCCGVSTEQQVCCCRRAANLPSLPLAVPNDTGRTLKWIPWIDAPLGELVIVTPERASSLRGRSSFAPFQRSTQSLLCVWRI